MTPRTPLPPVARPAGLDLSIPGDFQEPYGGPPEGFPYKDGPLPDASVNEPMFSTMLTTMHHRFDPSPDALLSGDVFIYYRDENDAPRVMAPDLVVFFGPDFAQYRNRSGFSLREIGKAPDLVMEVASPSTYRADLTYKRDAYLWMGAGELWLIDLDGGRYYGQPLSWELLGEDGNYHPMPVHTADDGVVWAHSPALGLDICLAGNRLRFYDPVAGEYLRSLSESEAARQDAEAALTAEQVAHEMARMALASAQAVRDDAQAARETAEAARARAKAARETAEEALANTEAARAREQAARETAEAARAREQAAKETAEEALASAEAARETAEAARARAKAARETAEDEISQLRAELQRLREGGTEPPA